MGDRRRHTADQRILWLIPLLETMLQQFPFRIRGFHSDNGSEFINHTMAKLLEKLDRTNQVAGAPFRRQRFGRSQNGAVIRKAYRLRPHRRRRTRRSGRRVPPRASESLRQLPSPLRGAGGGRRRQRQAPPDLSAVGHAVGTAPGNTALPESAAARRDTRRAAPVRTTPIRHRSRLGHAARVSVNC